MSRLRQRRRFNDLFSGPVVRPPEPRDQRFEFDVCVLCGYEISFVPSAGWTHDFTDAFDHPPAPRYVIEEEP